MLDVESGRTRSLDEAPLGERDSVVNEVPVRRPDVPDVRLQHDQAATGLEDGANLTELLDDGVRPLQVFEVVAGECDVEGLPGQERRQLQAIALHERHVRRGWQPRLAGPSPTVR